MDKRDLYFRAHTIPFKYQEKSWADGHATEPENAVIFHCASTADEKQDPLFGAYICAQLEDGKYTTREIGLFYREGHPEELRVFKWFVKDSAYELGSLEKFRRNILLKYLKAGALIVAYDAPAEISRIAIKWNKSLKKRRAFSFYFRMFKDKQTGKVRPRVTKRAIESALRAVIGELELLNRLREELQHHPLKLTSERCYSPATLSKGYFAAMEIKPPQE